MQYVHLNVIITVEYSRRRQNTVNNRKITDSRKLNEGIPRFFFQKEKKIREVLEALFVHIDHTREVLEAALLW